MKKYGKYEKRTEAAPAKQPKVKSALLQTYLTSLLCMVLCVTMFLGTSYAWFTSEVENVGNEIYVGTLKAGLDKKDDQAQDGWASLSDKINGVNVTNLFDKDIRWEPGYTSLETIRVTNQGDLAFKYVLFFTEGKLSVATDEAADAGDIATAAGNFEVWVYNHRRNGGAPTPASYADITAKDSGWVPAGSLAQLLSGDPVLENIMVTVRQDDKPDDETTPNGTTDGVKTVDTYTIALHMKEDASGEELMGKKITLNVKLVAYQMGSENDGFGNSAYDDATFVTTDKELQEALDNATGNTVIRFANDITGNVTVTPKEGVNITIDGNGKTFSGVITVDGKSGTYTTAGLTIKKVNFVADSISADACIRLGNGTNATRYTCNVTVEDCTFDVPGAVGVKSYTGGDKNLTITGCTATNKGHSLVQAKGIDGILIKNCKVYSKNGLNFNNSDNVKVISCTVDTLGYCVRFGESSGGEGTAETYSIQDCNLKSANDEGDAVIILRGTADYATLTIENTTLTGTPDITNNATGATVVK